MSERVVSGPDFETRLQREVERILADPAFQRSPVQSRLLAYLCEQTIARNRSISQIAVAVDGLGRPETADALTESYPRVQISRLRRNLALYYARCQPGEGLAAYIRHGDYQLRLAPPESAYGEQRARGAPAAPANDAPAPTPAAPIAAVPPAQPARTIPRRWSRPALAAAALFGVVAMASGWLAWQTYRGTKGAPPLEVRIEQPGSGSPRDPMLVLAAQHADNIANNSYVVRNLRPRERNGQPGYIVRLQRSESLAAQPVLEVSLYDPANQRLFHDSIPVGIDRSALLSRLNGALLHVVGPTGLIARRELAKIGERPRSDYECVIRTEAIRLQGSLSTELVESCLERFPDSQYSAYWLTRLAFNAYRNEALAGGTVAPSGEPWQDLQRAFAADPANPFANYVAAKVNFARGDCVGARPFIERTLTNANFHGTLTAATLSDASLCAGSTAEGEDAETRVEALVAGVPEPNPLLHVYLVFAAAAVDRPDLARRVLLSPTSEDPEGALADISDALGDGLASPAAFEANRERLERVVQGFYWGDASRRALMDKLAAVAAYRAAPGS